MTKILLTGTTSSGKTTLLSHFKQNPRIGVALVDEVARQVLEKQPELERDPRLQDILFAEQVTRENQATASGAGVVLCDRGVLDILAHALLFGQQLKPEWLEWAKHEYDYVYLLDKNDVTFQPTELQRQLNPELDWVKFRTDLDHFLKQSLLDCGLAYTLLAGTVEERIAIVEERIWQSLWDAEDRPPDPARKK